MNPLKQFLKLHRLELEARACVDRSYAQKLIRKAENAKSMAVLACNVHNVCAFCVYRYGLNNYRARAKHPTIKDLNRKNHQHETYRMRIQKISTPFDT